MVAIVITKATAPLIPKAVSSFLETPRKGQIPKNCDNTILFTNTALIKINIYVIILNFSSVYSNFKQFMPFSVYSLLQLNIPML